MEKVNTKLINFLLITIAIFFISECLDFYKNILLVVLDVIFPIFLSFFISYSLYPCVTFLNKKLSFNVSSFLTLFIVFTLFFLMIYFSVPLFTKEIGLISEDIVYFLSKFNIFDFDISSFVKQFLSFNNSLSLINKGTVFFTKFIIVFVLSIYFLFNMNNIKKFLSKYELFNMIDKDLYNYYKGFYLVILIEIVEYLVVYFLIGHPYYFLLATLSGLTSVIPFFGAIFTNLLALISAFSISTPLFIATSIVMVLIPLFNSYFIEPKIYNKTLKVSLISIIISCFVFGMLFGFTGVIFAIPFFLIIKNFITFFLLRER